MPPTGGPHPNRETLSAYADRGLPAEERARVARHVEQCPACAALLADLKIDLRTTSDFFQHIPAKRPPDELRRAVWRGVEGIDERRRRTAWLPFPFPSANVLAFGVTALLLVVVGPQVFATFAAFSFSRQPEARLAAPTVELPLSTPAVSELPSTPSPVTQAVSTVESATAVPTASTVPTASASPAPASPTAPAPGTPAPTQPAATPRPAQPTARTTIAAATAAPASPTTPPVQFRVVTGQLSAVNRTQKTVGVTDGTARAWQFGISEGTQIVRTDGRRIGFEDVGIGDQVEVTGFETQPAANTLMAAQLKVVFSAVAQAKQGPRVLVLLDGAASLRTPQYGFTGDWIKRLSETGYAVTALDPSQVTGPASLKDFHLIVIGYPATLSPAALQAVSASKLPVLDGDPRLVQPLGVGLNVDPAQPTKMTPGKTVEVAGQASPVTRGYNGDTAVANDTLYRTPIVANGTVLGSVADGARKLAVWSVTGNTMYLGFWWSNTGANHNAAYWTLFDRSVLLLLGRDPLGPLPGPTPAPTR